MNLKPEVQFESYLKWEVTSVTNSIKCEHADTEKEKIRIQFPGHFWFRVFLVTLKTDVGRMPLGWWFRLTIHRKWFMIKGSREKAGHPNCQTQKNSKTKSQTSKKSKIEKMANQPTTEKHQPVSFLIWFEFEKTVIKK